MMSNKEVITMPNRPKIGLALSGGGAKGIAHLGVLKALEERHIPIDMISGVSAGSIVGALYADGHSYDELLDFFQRCNLFQMVSLNLPKYGGFATMKGFRDSLKELLQAKKFEDLKIPTIINATDMSNGRNVYFSSGDLLDCIIASSTVPIFFRPTKIKGKLYIDGGIFCNLPAEILRKNNCDIVIGVHVNPINNIDDAMGLMDVAERVFHLSVNGNTIEQKKHCDIVIETMKAKEFGMFDSSKAADIMKIGYEATIDVLDKVNIPELLLTKEV